MNLKTMIKGEQEFIEKCRGGIFNKTKSDCLIDPVFDVNCVLDVGIKDDATSKEMSALCYASHEGNLEIVKYLIQKGAHVNYRCKRGESALFFAARKGHSKVVQCLLDAGAKSVFVAGEGMDRGLLENWEVFTQVFHGHYPNEILDKDSDNLKALCHTLLEHESNAVRPTILYEALFCSLTAFRSPFAIYCVGAYSYFCPELAILKFSEENFLGSLCRAFDSSRTRIFVNAIHSLLSASNLRSKDIAHNLVKLFNWCDLLRMLSEDLARCNTSHDSQWVILLETTKKLMTIFSILIANFNVRSDFQDQFQMLGSEDFTRIGKLIKYVFDSYGNSASGDKCCTTDGNIWQFLFFLLKHQIRLQEIGNMNRLLLKQNATGMAVNNHSPNNPNNSEFERRVLLKCFQEDVTLAHMLLDNNVKVTGDCFVVSIKRGHLDLVNRFIEDKDLLFCKEITELLKVPLTTKNSANRNMRRCLKMVKSHRSKAEEIRRKVEEELLEDDFIPVTKSKKSKKKRKTLEPVHEVGEKENIRKIPEDRIQEETIKTKTEVNSSNSNVKSGCDNPITNGIVETSVPKKKNRKNAAARRKKKQKQENKFSGDSAPENNENEALESTGHRKTQPEKSLPTDKSLPIDIPTSQTSWKEIAKSSGRRRRQSSSSSDCSSGSRNVHFSHPLNFYENTKPRAPSKPRYPPTDAVPGGGNLKKRAVSGLNEAYRTTNGPRFSGLDSFSFNGFSNLNDDFLHWNSRSTRWAARFEDLSEFLPDALKTLRWRSGEEEQNVFFCDDQFHLNIGAGPDFSNVFLGLTDKGDEVTIKKISSKRSPVLSQKQIVDSLITLPSHVGLNTYHSIIKDRSHCYVIQSVGEYSLEQIYRKKYFSNPLSEVQTCQQIANAVQFLHSHDILHMALKPRNVFLGVGNQWRLSDYGIHCREVIKRENKHIVSPNIACMCWMARETIISEEKENLGFSKASDIVSLGMLFFYISTSGGHPFGDPDVIPGVCINNINRGAYSLKVLTDPFVHHLIRNMVLKEIENRFNIDQVVQHPYFWSSDRKSKYLKLIIEKSLNGGKTKDGFVLEQLKNLENDILHTYTLAEYISDIPQEYIADVESLLAFIRSCATDNELYETYVPKNSEAGIQNVYEYFIRCFPSLILSTFKLYCFEELQNCSTSDIASVNGLPSLDPAADTNFKSDDKNTFKKNGRVSLNTENMHFPENIDSKFRVEKVVKNTKQYVQPISTSIAKQNGMDENQPTDKFNKNAEGEISDSEKTKNATRKLDIPFTKKNTSNGWFKKQENSPDDRESPDDWIEIGSPLGNEVYGVNTRIQGDGDCRELPRDTSPVSGGSVDDCFEFGSFSDADWPENHLKAKIHENGSSYNCNMNNNNVYGKPRNYTDIDELD